MKPALVLSYNQSGKGFNVFRVTGPSLVAATIVALVMTIYLAKSV